MCGIFGVIVKEDSNYSNKFLKKSLKLLAKLSETRGKDSSGLCSLNHKNNSFVIIKGPIPANQLLKRGKVIAAPFGIHFDAYKNKMVKTWCPFGNRGLIQKIKFHIAKKIVLAD